MYKLDRYIINLSTFIKHIKIHPSEIDFVTVTLTKEGVTISLDLNVYSKFKGIFISKDLINNSNIEIVNDIDILKISRFTLIIKSSLYKKIHLSNIHTIEMNIHESYNYIRLNKCDIDLLYLIGYINRLTVTNTDINYCIGNYINELKLRSNNSINQLYLIIVNKIRFSKRLVDEVRMTIYCSNVGVAIGCKNVVTNISDSIKPSCVIVDSTSNIESLHDISRVVFSYIISLGL